MLLYRRRDLQVFGYTPRGHRNGRKQAVGVTARVRRRGRWRWVQAQVYWPREDLRLARGTATLELATWLKDARGERVSYKAFVRLKAGLGGRRPCG